MTVSKETADRIRASLAVREFNRQLNMARNALDDAISTANNAEQARESMPQITAAIVALEAALKAIR